MSLKSCSLSFCVIEVRGADTAAFLPACFEEREEEEEKMPQTDVSRDSCKLAMTQRKAEKIWSSGKFRARTFLLPRSKQVFTCISHQFTFVCLAPKNLLHKPCILNSFDKTSNAAFCFAQTSPTPSCFLKKLKSARLLRRVLFNRTTALVARRLKRECLAAPCR